MEVIKIGTPRYPKDMATEWQAMKRKVSNTFTSANSRLGTESIGTKVVNILSGLIVNAGAFFRSLYSNGNDAVYIGTHTVGSPPFDVDVEGLIIRRPNGALAFYAWGNSEFGDAQWGLYDLEENKVISDNPNGKGLFDPWIPYNVVRTSLLTTPASTNSTTTYVPHHTCYGWQQHPEFMLDLYVQNTGTAKAKIRVRDTLTSSVIWESNELDTGWHSFGIPHSIDDWKALFIYDFEIKVNSGTGTVGFTIVSINGAAGVS